ncbi:deoxyribonuclease 1 like 1 [Chelydra serpentina]|uniref:Deoxyribonuclease-1-like 1 n=1 Tax=Chelydra serpentina TaxID=8475 RepID=A0A8T1RVW2_CHESE|nr:deoxyribonuclease 1 like 1 [Chelydra serpentina]
MGLPPCHLCTLLLLLCPAGAPFRICAFNMQRFAGPKAAKVTVMDTLVKIVSRCDIMVLQEVLDAKGQAVPALIRALNRSAGPASYAALSSPLLGAGNYQERYVFVYRSSRTQLLDSYMYLDENPARPDALPANPLCALQPASKALPMLVLVPQHTVPKKAEAEIDALYDVFLDIQAQWGTQDAFPGDLTPTALVAKKRWARSAAGGAVPWLIGDAADTTVRNSTRCASTGSWCTGSAAWGWWCPAQPSPSTSPARLGSRRPRRWRSVTTTRWRCSWN